MKKDNRGVALVWAICILVILTIIVTGILSLTRAYHDRSQNDYLEQQAYFSARSGVEMIVNRIEDGETRYLPAAVGEHINLTDLGFGNNLGEATAVVDYPEDKKLVIRVDVDFRGKSYTMKAEMVGIGSDWKFSKYTNQ